jgi:hypothetical protein
MDDYRTVPVQPKLDKLEEIVRVRETFTEEVSGPF